MDRPYTLYELNSMVRDAVEGSLFDNYIVEAEVSEAREQRGHCYIELVQKDIMGNTPVARASAICWKTTWQKVRKKFERITRQSIHPGMKLLLLVSANFHEAYGFSWIVEDIDPTYTLGDMARRRAEIVATLKEEGIFDLQKQLKLSLFAQRVAVISSENAAGYGDFCNQLLHNDYHLHFSIELFPAVMQGERVEESIIAALNTINKNSDQYDVVVIIRGGGATADLAGFDTLALAENVANFPLPIITGIGLDRDESVLDMVAFQSVKTPTAAATLLTDNLVEVFLRVEQAASKLTMLLNLMSARYEAQVSQSIQKLEAALNRRLMQEQHRLNVLETKIQSNDPKKLMRKGYSITKVNGKVVRNKKDVKAGDKLKTIFHDGEIDSVTL